PQASPRAAGRPLRLAPPVDTPRRRRGRGRRGGRGLVELLHRTASRAYGAEGPRQPARFTGVPWGFRAQARIRRRRRGSPGEAGLATGVMKLFMSLPLQPLFAVRPAFGPGRAFGPGAPQTAGWGTVVLFAPVVRFPIGEHARARRRGSAITHKKGKRVECLVRIHWSPIFIQQTRERMSSRGSSMCIRHTTLKAAFP